ncbi:hypothetical protein [Sulfitobacter sp. HI0023]|uniref:hypothetical protein n=1 Tax=Sulfitobacter sp. HI0023 TaxID=1822225 RepID=UPI0012373431|nr:hypothetical protein [Sulfitobacter sp. HI0023]
MKTPHTAEASICPDRPDEPNWIRDLPAQDAYKRVLVQDIYRTRAFEQIALGGACPCDVRFPSWATAEHEFQERFEDADRWEMLEASREYNERANELRPAVMDICRADGNW